MRHRITEALMKDLTNKSVWFITGSQHLYGPKVLEQVAKNSEEIVAGFNQSNDVCVPIVCKETVKSPEEILSVCQQANNDENCLGVVLWMHTFSPAKMWISGLKQLNKPFVHLHTQFSEALPWESIDMNYMNLNQSAHGDREFGFIGTRLGLDRKVVVGHWQNPQVHSEIDQWCRAAIGIQAGYDLKVARFGDNMRQVAVTEGNKVSAQIQFGYEVNAYGLGELTEAVNAVSDADVSRLLDEYASTYVMDPKLLHDSDLLKIMQKEARLEAGMESFLTAVGAKAFTNTFENLTGIDSLPGLATQRLMSKGYGYGGEGDWKTSAMTHIMKTMAKGLPGGTSFMEDYTYHFGVRDQILGAHMLEVCPSIAAAKPRLEIHTHTIGVHCEVPRLLFSGQTGPANAVSVVDLGNRFRMIVSKVNAVEPPADLPKLPVAHALWEPEPNLQTAAAAWIHAGGAHHTVYTQALSLDTLGNYADILGMEMVVIDQQTEIRRFKNELRANSLYYRLASGI